MNNYIETIGIEVHVELKSKNKIFSNSINEYGVMANTNVNVIDMGYPGTLPNFNIEVLKDAIKACHVLNLNITKNIHFDRKNYFYPDNSKNFQITQQRTPIGRNGYITINNLSEIKKIEIEEMHMEEDTSKSVHGNTSSLLDFNRAGVPLLEIVTKPCIKSSKEAVLYLLKLKELLLYSDVSDCRIEEGSMRCDANISISNTDKLGVKVEVKNIGSISNVGDAIEYEIKRQKEILNRGEKVIEETRRYDDKLKQTISMRVKETGNDYRYIPEPDIPYINITDEFINSSIKELKTLPDDRRVKYEKSLINPINIEKIIQNKEISDYLEKFNNINLVIASNLLLGDIMAYLNKNQKNISDTKLSDDKFMDLVNLLDKKEINNKIFKEILIDLMETPKYTLDIVKEKNICLNNDLTKITEIINKALLENEVIVNDYKNGNERAIKALMGLVMKESRGSIDPASANNLLKEYLNK